MGDGKWGEGKVLVDEEGRTVLVPPPVDVERLIFTRNMHHVVNDIKYVTLKMTCAGDRDFIDLLGNEEVRERVSAIRMNEPWREYKGGPWPTLLGYYVAFGAEVEFAWEGTLDEFKECLDLNVRGHDKMLQTVALFDDWTPV